MNKELIDTNLTSFYNELQEIVKNIQRVTGNNVYGKELRDDIKKISSRWFGEFSNVLPLFNVSKEIVEKYDSTYDEILNLSLKVSRKQTYLKCFNVVNENWGEELLVPILKYSAPITSVAHLSNILQSVTLREKEYLEEAIGCAERNFLRASIVLGWCATVNRMHRVVEKLGFNEFNIKSEEMKNLTAGRYKRFNKKFNIQNFVDLQASVFDNDLLWVLEYWGLIDSNQNGRLFRCYEMRNNSAHPGDAVITPENLASFYSDIKSIVFDNLKFSL